MNKNNDRENNRQCKSRWQFWIVKTTVRLVIQFRAEIREFLMNLFLS